MGEDKKCEKLEETQEKDKRVSKNVVDWLSYFFNEYLFFSRNDGSIPMRKNLERRSRRKFQRMECNKIYVLNSALNYMIKFLLVAIECRLALIPL